MTLAENIAGQPAPQRSFNQPAALFRTTGGQPAKPYAPGEDRLADVSFRGKS